MKNILALLVGIFSVTSVYGWEALEAVQIQDAKLRAGQIQLKNDSMPDEGGQGFLQQGFVKDEKAGIWVQVPKDVKMFKVDFFRVLLSSAKKSSTRTQVFFQMQTANKPSMGIAAEIENAAEVTPGPFWNDIPAKGLQGGLSCIAGGGYVGASLEFTHNGLPSILRDFDGQSNPAHNLIYEIQKGWLPSAVFDVNGDWILRIIGHEAKEGEC